MTMTDELLRLYEQDKDVALIFDSFSAIEQIYQESLIAMGRTGEAKPVSKSSNNITLFAGPVASTARHQLTPSSI